MNQFTRRSAVAVCMLLTCFNAHAQALPGETLDDAFPIARSLNEIAEGATRSPLQLQVAQSLNIQTREKVMAAVPGDAVFGDVSMDTVQAPAWPPATRKDFLAAVWPHAERVARQIGVTPHALVAQAALESGWGQRLAIGPDGQPSFNLFGIKAGRNWTGDRTQVATHEYVRGVRRPKVAEFRSYESIGESFDDYVAMLRANDRYAAALKHGGPSRHFAKRLQKAGYSTDPHYAAKIHRIANSHLVRGEKKKPAAKKPLRTTAHQEVATRE